MEEKNRRETSVNIIGAGLAGLSAAITLAKRGATVNLISAQPSERAQSVLAEGGINAALDLMSEHDSVGEHMDDTLSGGVNLADREAVHALCAAAPDIVQRLVRLGVPFQTERGRLLQRNFGGQRKKRTFYAGNSTGKMIMTALIDEARRYEAAGQIRRYAHHRAQRVVQRDGRCVGAEVRDLWSGAAECFSGPVIVAVGGCNGFFYGRTTGTTANTGELQAALFADGVAFGNLEMIQYHPTTVRITGKRLLISEAARGEGGRLYILKSGRPWYFMEDKYPTLGNLMPRDVVSKEIVTVCAQPDTEGEVFLDMTGIPGAVWDGRLADLREEILHYLSLDPRREPVPVQPGIHFFMGGLLVDSGHRTNLPGLYAAGECACQYHGANRLGGNSMLAALHGGRTAAETLCQDGYADRREPDISTLPVAADDATSHEFRDRLAEILAAGMGIFRDEEKLDCAFAALTALENEAQTENEREQMLLAKAMLLSADRRQESRGAHVRTDYPARDDARFQRTTMAVFQDGKIHISFSEIGAPVLSPAAEDFRI